MSVLWIVPGLGLLLMAAGFELHEAAGLAALVAFGYWHGRRGTLEHHEAARRSD
jgi:hypothetical protein